MTKIKVELVFAWYDIWVGAYIDRKARKLYVFPVPCIGLCFELERDLPFDPGYVHAYVKSALLSVEPDGLTDPQAWYFLNWLEKQ